MLKFFLLISLLSACPNQSAKSSNKRTYSIIGGQHTAHCDKEYRKQYCGITLYDCDGAIKEYHCVKIGIWED